MLLLIILTIIVSYPLIHFLRPQGIWLEKISLSYFLGFGILTYASFLLHIYIGAPFNLITFSLLQACLLLFGLWLNRKKPWSEIVRYNHNPLFNKSSKIWLVIGVTAFPIILALIVTHFWPIRDWDALTLYDFRGKAIHETGSLSVLLEQYSEYYFAYPLFTSLVHTYAYSFSVENPLPFYAFNLLFFEICFFMLLKRKTNFFIAILATCVISFCYPIFSNALMAYTNLPYSIYIILGLLYLLEWFESSGPKTLVVPLLLTGIALWIRNAEPFWLISLIIIAIRCVQIKSYWPLWLSFFNFALFIVPWIHYTTYQVNIPTSPTVVPIAEGIKTINLEYFRTMILYLYKYFVSPFLFLHTIFLLSVLTMLKSKKVANLPLSLAIFLSYGMVIGGTILLSLTYTKWFNVGGSLERMSLLFIPLIIFYAAEALNKVEVDT